MRPRLMTDTVIERLVEGSRMGLSLGNAAEFAGISRRTLTYWLTRGRDQALAISAGQRPTAAEVPYVDLFDKVTTARAQAAARAIAQIQRAGAGGAVLEEVTRKFRDSVTGEIVEETTLKRQVPDWKASAWYLTHQHGTDYVEGYGLDAELASEDDEEQMEADLEGLAQRLSVTLHAVEYPPEIEPADDDVVDADIVE
jgi:transposase